MNDTIEKRILAAIFDNSNEGIVISDADNNIIAINHAFTDLMGYTEEEIIGKVGLITRSGKHDDTFYNEIWDTLEKKDIWSGEMWVRRKNGEVFLEWLVLKSIKNQEGKVVNYITIFTDITERKTSAEHINFLANYDALTKLPNFKKLINQLEIYLHNASIYDKNVVVMFIGIDQLKTINASFGLVTGDTVLQVISKRLQERIGINGIVARPGGDRFVLVIPDLKNTNAVPSFCATILNDIKKHIIINDQAITVTACIGISIYPTNGKLVDAILEKAETAMFQAKRHGRNSYQYFTTNMNAMAKERLILENKIRNAIENQEFKLLYHPIVSLETGKIYGVESLIRWFPPNSDPVPPLKFIPIAEDSGLILPITNWVLKTACQTNQKWIQAGLPIIPTAVNIPSIQFQQKTFRDDIIKLLQLHNLNPRHIKLEITEGTLMQDVNATIQILSELQHIGFHFSIDDFGTGYSSLSYLKKLPINDLKIDQSFIRDLEFNKDSQAIVLTIISLAKNLNLNTIAEGVETIEQVEFLRQHGCNYIQGYYFSEPITSTELMQLLRDDKNLYLNS